MKKYVLSLAVIAIFVFYSVSLRHQDTATVIAPTSVTSSKTTASSPTSSASSAPSTNSATAPTSTFKDGTYTGSVADAFYGNIQVSTTISGGKIVGVTFLQSPNDQPNSIEVNKQAMPLLRQEAIQAQSAHVSVVTGATDTSQAFTESLSSALSKAS